MSSFTLNASVPMGIFPNPNPHALPTLSFHKACTYTLLAHLWNVALAALNVRLFLAITAFLHTISPTTLVINA